MIVNIKDAYKSFGAQSLFENLNMQVKTNEKVALIGANGVGKTTLFNVLLNQESLDQGDVFLKPNIRMGFLEQIHLDTEPILVKDYL